MKKISKKISAALALPLLVVLTAFMSGCHSSSLQPNANPPSTTTSPLNSVATKEKSPTEASMEATELMRQGALAKDPNVTIAFFKEGVQADPTNMVNLSMLGFALKHGGENQEALKAFQQLSKSDDPVWQNVAKTQTKDVLQKMQHNS